MNFSLTPQLEQFVRNCAESGDYNNASEVVRESIRLFKRTEEEHSVKLLRLQDALDQADAAISRGESSVFNSAQDLDDFFAKL